MGWFDEARGGRGGRTATVKWRPLAFVLTASAAGALLTLGILRKEFGDVLINAVLL
jgi:hypothetical protein